MIRLGRMAAYAWAGPYSVLGLAVGVLGLATGSRVNRQQGTLEFCGGRLGRLATRLPAPFNFSAITLGHVILATDAVTLSAVRAHERVHVRQYQRWGILFVPAYLASSLLQLLLGRRPYMDNHFEREAYGPAGKGPRR